MTNAFQETLAQRLAGSAAGISFPPHAMEEIERKWASLSNKAQRKWLAVANEATATIFASLVRDPEYAIAAGGAVIAGKLATTSGIHPIAASEVLRSLLAEVGVTTSLRRIDYPEGRFGPAMLDGDDEMTGKELKLIAKSHGFDLRLKVEEWEGEAGEIIERGGSFAEALEATCLPQVDKDGYQLVGAWDDEEGELVLAYVRPLTKDAKPEGSANG